MGLAKVEVGKEAGELAGELGRGTREMYGKSSEIGHAGLEKRDHSAKPGRPIGLGEVGREFTKISSK